MGEHAIELGQGVGFHVNNATATQVPSGQQPVWTKAVEAGVRLGCSLEHLDDAREVPGVIAGVDDDAHTSSQQKPEQLGQTPRAQPGLETLIVFQALGQKTGVSGRGEQLHAGLVQSDLLGRLHRDPRARQTRCPSRYIAGRHIKLRVALGGKRRKHDVVPAGVVRDRNRCRAARLQCVELGHMGSKDGTVGVAQGRRADGKPARGQRWQRRSVPGVAGARRQREMR